ncbi:MAG TPA: response regulator [Candidatus Saccharimonadales bacterium]|nr:response regulator [Candidatus Saccharimonadales bacterium]
MNTVLIIEDDQILSDMYHDKFRLNAFKVLIAKDGERGLEIAIVDKPDIIILDLALPKMKGVQIMESLRKNSWGKTVPIIVLTNLNVDGKILEAITKFTPVYCLLKSNITPEEVINKAKEVLKQ